MALRMCAVALLALGFALPAPAAQAAIYAPPSVRQRVDLNASWRFHKGDVSNAQLPAFDDAAWTAVTVPHTWNATDGQDGGANYYRGIGWYRRHYTPPADMAGRKLWLQFAGASTVADVWVNGTYLGRHSGAFARFRFDATAAMVPGQDNVIAVKVNNATDWNVAPLGGDFTVFGGLYRNVSLWVTDQLAVRMLDYAGPGVYLRQRAVGTSSAAVDVTTKLWNNSPRTRSVAVRVVITDSGGTIVADTTTAPASLATAAGLDVVQTVTIAAPHLWRGRADPYLYHANVEIRDAATGAVTDALTEPLGLRTVTVDPAGGLTLDGSHLALHGVSLHQDWINRGWAITDAEHVRDFDLMDEMGVNAIRTAHYQQDQKVYNLADERGYLVWTEIPLVDSMVDSTGFRANIAQQLVEMIRQNANHPSIAFWGLGNEQRSDDAATNALLGTLAGIVRTEDPDRLSAYAQAGSTSSPLNDHTDVIGYNLYEGWYYGSLADFGSWVDYVHGTYPARRIAVTEYGAGGSIAQHQESPPQPDPYGTWHPEEYQSLFHESHWQQIQARGYLLGTFVWNMFDFAADQRSDGDTPGRNDKGLVTYDRATRKDAFFWYKANWTSTPFVTITSRRWTTRTNPVTTIKVYGTADSVVLRLNGTALGAAKTSTNHIYSWPNVRLRSGNNTVTATGTRAGRTLTDTVVWKLR